MTKLKNRATRYWLELPVRYRTWGASQWRAGRTANVSRSGILLRPDKSDEAASPGAILEVLLTLSPDRKPVQLDVLCRGPVVRHEASNGSAAGMALRIVHYRMGASEQAEEA